jgi:hypothetical protein
VPKGGWAVAAGNRNTNSVHQQFDLVGALAPPAQHDQLEEAAQHPVAEGHNHPSILPDASSGERGAAPIEREPDCRPPHAQAT